MNSSINSFGTNKQKPPTDQDISELPTYKIDTSQNIMVLLCEEEKDARIIVESFLQANLKTRTKYKCCVLHHCLKENRITHDPYYIVKNIIFNILGTMPSLANYMRIQEHQFFKEITQMYGQ